MTRKEDRLSTGYGDYLLQGMDQLPDVARPIISGQDINKIRRHPLYFPKGGDI
jgi:hypothetical protein